MSLTISSARDVRIEREINAAKNPAEKARLSGYYDFMLARENRSAASFTTKNVPPFFQPQLDLAHIRDYILQPP